ncbi:hypothetical protein [Novacetimonas hansenii]|uniref:Sulfotransferase n=2 Tax=Novacetimonas hansenii TaxID=436 RepID=A0AAW5END0_NOVHA|nr:hypothetical protein [Novacetimonas hansenii]MCJ8353283.1 hypothetical protein [Novacetimonas hansenii]
MLHETMHFFTRTAPATLRQIPSVAILRDPVARFVSSYCYARAGGAAIDRLWIRFVIVT